MKEGTLLESRPRSGAPPQPAINRGCKFPCTPGGCDEAAPCTKWINQGPPNRTIPIRPLSPHEKFGRDDRAHHESRQFRAVEGLEFAPELNLAESPDIDVRIEKEHARCRLGAEPIDESTVPDQTREPTIDLSLEAGNLLCKGERAIDGFRLGLGVKQLLVAIDSALIDEHILATTLCGHDASSAFWVLYR